MVKICAIYVRKSKQNDNSDSMETQIQMCTDYINQKFPGCIIKIYDKDYGITGHSIKKRKDFQRMMNDIRNGLINLVAIQRYDRLARNTRDFCNIYHEMEQVGCELVSVSQQIDTTTPYGKKFMYDQASMAELEWALNSERRKDVNAYARAKRKCNLSPYALPFGFTTKIIDGVRRMIIDKETEHIVRNAIAYYKSDQSKAGTLRYINFKYGLNLSHSFMDNLIKSDFYHGQYRDIMDYCEAYMTLEEHEELRAINRKYIRHYSSDRKYFLFTGLIICPECGSKMESQSQVNTSGNRYYYYRCQNVYKRGNCTFKGNINEIAVENYLLNNVQDEMSRYFALNDTFSTESKKVVDLGKYKAEMERLTNAYLKGRIDEDFYDSEYERIKKIISDSEAESTQESKLSPQDLKEIFCDNWQETYLKLNRQSKREYWHEIIKEINIKQDKSVSSISFL